MKKPFLVGLLVSMAAGLGTIAVKSLFTRYPGMGDLLLISAILDGLSGLGISVQLGLAGETLMYPAKAGFAAALFGIAFLASSRIPKKRFAVSLGATLVCLVAMSVGEVAVI